MTEERKQISPRFCNSKFYIWALQKIIIGIKKNKITWGACEVVGINCTPGVEEEHYILH